MIAHVGGETRAAQAKALKDHLAVCPRCRQTWAVYESSFAALRQSKVRELPERFMQSFWPELRQRLAQSKETKPDWFTEILLRARALWMPRLIGAVSLAGAVLLAMWIYFSTSPQTSVNTYTQSVSLPSVAHVPERNAAFSAPSQSLNLLEEVPITVSGKSSQRMHRLHFFVLRPLEPRPRLDSQGRIGVLNSASLPGQHRTYVLPSARLASLDE